MTSKTTAAALLLAAATMAASPAEAGQKKGTFVITATITVNSAIGNGKIATGQVSAQAIDATYVNTGNVSTTATVADGKLVIKAAVPYIWTVADGTKSVTLNASASISLFNPDTGVTTYYSTFISKSVPLPANGAKTKVALTGTL